MRRMGLLVVALLLHSGPGFAQSTQERIEKGTAAFEETFNAGDAKAAAAFYTDDATVLPPGVAPVGGAEAIVAYFQKVIDAGIKLDLESVEVVEAGDFVFDVGTFASTRPDGSVNRGKMMAVLQRGDDGRWRVHRVIWNTDSPTR